jgi:hypothetical protein
MMCGCIERIDGELKPSGQCLDATILFGDRKATTMLIRTDKWKHENRRGKPTRMIASFCPFCGTKYERFGDAEAQAGDGAASTSHDRGEL